MTSAQSVDIAVIGGGIAGATAAAHLAPHTTVALLEQESELAYHTTSRSAAVYFEGDDEGVFDHLVATSRPFFDADHPELDAPLLSPMPVLMVGDASRTGEYARLVARAQDYGVAVDLVEGDGFTHWCPVLDLPPAVGRIETTSAEIDVMALHQLYIRRAVTAGSTITRSARVTMIGSGGGGRRWHLTTEAGPVEADIIVNAAGAWADLVAAMAGVTPVGLGPLHRTAFTVRIDQDPAGWPFVYSELDGLHCYFKPESGNQLLCSLADETPTEPGDARPEEIDVALAIERINTITSLDIRSVATTWAGQRTFTTDRVPVWGFDDQVDGFFWFAGQGGWGIGTSPVAGAVAESLIVDGTLPEPVAARGVTVGDLSPARFR